MIPAIVLAIVLAMFRRLRIRLCRGRCRKANNTEARSGQVTPTMLQMLRIGAGSSVPAPSGYLGAVTGRRLAKNASQARRKTIGRAPSSPDLASVSLGGVG